MLDALMFFINVPCFFCNNNNLISLNNKSILRNLIKIAFKSISEMPFKSLSINVSSSNKFNFLSTKL